MDARPDNSAIIGEWADWLDAMGKAPRTVEIYVGIVHRFLSRPYTRGRHLLDLTSTELVAHLTEIGKHGATKKQARVALRSLYGFINRRGWRDDDPAAILEGAKETIHRSPPAPFTRHELTRLVSAAFRRDPHRGWALLACYGLGTRRTEFVLLRPQDVHLEQRKVHLAFTKGDIRSTFATRLDHAGVATGVIRDLLGHESIETTNWYIGVYEGDGARAVAIL